MDKKSATKKKTKRVTNKMLNRKIITSSSLILLLALLIFGIGYFILGNDILKVSVNTTTASYISFNNLFDSDSIKIYKLKKLNDKDGRVSNPTSFNITTDGNNMEYEVILIPVNVTTDYDHIKFYLTDEDGNELVYDKLSSCSESDDFSGNVIYTGKLNSKRNNDKMDLRIWVSDDYSKKLKANSFIVEVKLK